MTPLERAAQWLEEARTAIGDDADAMTLATASADGAPSARVVLCRGIDSRGLRFFTNYESRKGAELAANPRAAIVFHWAALGRQLRAEGPVQRVPVAESDAYFEARPRGHRISAHASPQSRPIPSLEPLRERAAEIERELQGREVPRPSYWGGYRIAPVAIEFWVHGIDRLHERIRCELREGAWQEVRLAP
jgi:pyridoxamine 5'-phosphate oxidase